MQCNLHSVEHHQVDSEVKQRRQRLPARRAQLYCVVCTPQNPCGQTARVATKAIPHTHWCCEAPSASAHKCIAVWAKACIPKAEIRDSSKILGPSRISITCTAKACARSVGAPRTRRYMRHSGATLAVLRLALPFCSWRNGAIGLILLVVASTRPLFCLTGSLR